MEGYALDYFWTLQEVTNKSSTCKILCYFPSLVSEADLMKVFAI